MTRNTGKAGAAERAGKKKRKKKSAGAREAMLDALTEAARYGGSGLDGFRVAESGDDDPVLVTPRTGPGTPGARTIRTTTSSAGRRTRSPGAPCRSNCSSCSTG